MTSAPIAAADNGERAIARRNAIRSRFSLAVPLAMLAATLILLHRATGDVHLRGVAHALVVTPPLSMLLAVLLTASAYLLLAGYDLLALRYAAAPLDLSRTVLASAISYGVSQTLGFALLTGGSVRARLWHKWGIAGDRIALATAFIGATFVIGIAGMSGAALLWQPASLIPHSAIPLAAERIAGALALGCIAAYLGWTVLYGGQTRRLGMFEVRVPDARLALSQLVLAGLDWTVAALVLYVLLPAPHVPFAPFVGLFVLAQLLGVASQVPGGVGVFETCMIVALHSVFPQSAATDRVLAALLVYRTVYYLLPFSLASAAMASIEIGWAPRFPDVMSRMVAVVRAASGKAIRASATLQPLLPTALGVTTFVGGTVLLLSGSTPAAPGRMRLLESLLPLGVVDLSHFAASMAGVGLLVLGYALHRRLDAAWGMTLTLLVIGVVSSVLKGLDWEEASILAVLVVVLLPSREMFYRRAALTSEPLSREWIGAMAAVIGGSIWLGLFAFRHVEYSNDLWWQFATRGDAPRFLRATTGAVAVTVALASWRLLRSATYDADPPTVADLARAAKITVTSPASIPAVALLGDKSLMFSESGQSFLMFGVSGRSWIALGDVVGRHQDACELAWRFKSEADAHGAWAVFYQVTSAALPLYIDLGLSLLKIGEEAIVPLDTFSMEHTSSRWMRRAVRDSERAGLTFDVIAAQDVPLLMPALRDVSDDWLSRKHTSEKGFSLGRFSESYLRNFPVAVVRAPDEAGRHRIVAFANLWCGAPGGEMAPDLMRTSVHAPRSTMDFLLVRLLQWGQAQGYSRMSLGMAPLSGIARQAPARPSVDPLWSRAAAFVYGRGEYFYNFRGLRGYKEKFSPVWEPRYLAAPGGIALPRVLTNVATLIAGGVVELVRK